MRLFGEIKRAEFISRPNRFVVVCALGRRKIRAYLPNPGRLRELLLPGATVYLERAGAGRKHPFTAVAVEARGRPVILHTLRVNDVAEYLLKKGLVPGLEGAEIVKREFLSGRSRFDFLLKKGGKDMLLEVKSCTLFSRYFAMFPDAVTERGRRHVEELAASTERGSGAAVLFVVGGARVKYFMPDYHTDIDFALSLLKARERIRVIPLGISVDKTLEPGSAVRLLDVPWDIVDREARDRGAYLLVINLARRRTIEAGGLGRLKFEKGFYVYTGSARKNLSKRLSRHRRRGKKKFWHIDYLTALSAPRYILPVRTEDALECSLARAVGKISAGEVEGFGSSDCGCPSHLFYFTEDPVERRDFHDLLLWFRADRLISKGMIR